jgi:flagellar biosynthesis/type III secretory pathway protein FliH
MDINLTDNTSDKELAPTSTIASSRSIIEAAKAEASRLTQLAELEAEEIRLAARQRGIEEANLSIAQRAMTLECSMESEILNNEQKILEIALSVASSVIADAIKQQPESILPRIKRAAAKLVAAPEIRLSVNAEDLSYVSSSLDELSESLGRVSLTIEQDSSLQPGEAKLKTSSSVVHSSPSGHLAAIKTHFLGTPTFNRKP